MLRLGDMSDSREVLVVDRPDTDDVISSSKPEAAEIGGMTSHPVKSPDDESGASLTVDTPTSDVKLGAAGSKTVNTTVTNNNNYRRPAEASSVPSTSCLQTSANGVSLSTNRKHHGGRRRGQRSAVATTLEAMERVELNAERDLVSVLGAQRTSRNLTYFVILYSAVLCALAAFRAHLRGVEYQLSRKYFLSASQLRLMTGIELAGIVVSLAFVAVFGRRSHKPMLMFFGTLVCAVGSILCPVSYFVESASRGSPLHNVTAPARERLVAAADSSGNYSTTPTTTVSSSNQSRADVPDVVEYLLTELCPSRHAVSAADGLTARYSDPCVALNSTSSSTYSFLTYSTVAVGVLLHGTGTGMIMTTGFIYIDENALNKAVPVYFGVLVSMSGFGQFMGSCIAWWFTSYSQHLSAPDHNHGVVAEWEYRAWWLGFVLLAVITFFLSALFLVYPKWIAEPSWVSVSRQRYLRRLQRLLDWQKADRRRRREQRKKAREQQRRQINSIDAAISYQLGGAADEVRYSTDVNKDDRRRPSESGSVTSSAVTSSVAGNSSAATEETNVSWNSSAHHLEKLQDSDSECDDDNQAALDNEDGDDAGHSSMSYSNSVFRPDDEQAGMSGGGSAVPAVTAPDCDAVERSRSRSAKGVQFDISSEDVQEQADQPELIVSTVFTRDRKLSLFEKKLRELQNVVTVPVYTIALLAEVFAAYMLAGYHTNVARFVQQQYGYDYQHAWFYTNGLCFGLALSIGPVVAGIIVHRRQLTLRQQLKLVIAMLVTSAVLFLLVFAVSCPDAGYVWQNNTITPGPADAAGSQRTWIESCNAKCSCGSDDVRVQLVPVCINDAARRYYSPCHAGCSRLQQTSDGRIKFSGCSCDGGPSAGESVDCVSDCAMYGVYWLILFLALISHSMTRVGVIMIFIRTISHKRRMLSLGLAVWVISVAAYVPGEALYRAVETSNCLADMTQLDCHSEPVCWRYDVDLYRYTIHGLTVAFQALAALIFTVALYLSPAPDAAADVMDSPAIVGSFAGGSRVNGSSAAERRTPVCGDVRAGASDVTADVNNVAAASQSMERYGSVYETPL